MFYDALIKLGFAFREFRLKKKSNENKKLIYFLFNVNLFHTEHLFRISNFLFQKQILQ